jgi:uncharacterized protein YjdB
MVIEIGFMKGMGFIYKTHIFIVFCLSVAFMSVHGQSCPIYDKRNNGQGTVGCAPDLVPTGKVKSGQFDFTNQSLSTSYTVDSIYLSGQKYQAGSTLFNGLGSIWFGGYNGSSKTICFYGNNVNDNAPPAGRWRFYFKNNSNLQTICDYVLTTSGTLSSLSAGVISGNQTICKNSTPSPISSTSSASGCGTGSPTYQWQSSTTSSGSGFSNISGATSASFSPGPLTQTTYFIRIASCSDGATSATDPITIDVITAGTLSGNQSISLNQSTQFATDGTANGTWSSNNPSVAQVNSSTGIITGISVGNATITYTVSSGGVNCTASRTVNVSPTLPVAFGKFESLIKENGVVLNWETFQEVGAKNFYIQRSDDAQIWKDIAIVNAKGNSTNLTKYSFFDNYPSRLNFYRLQQNDLDGKWSYSKTVYIAFDHLGLQRSKSIISKNRSFTFFAESSQDFIIVNMNGVTVIRGKFFAGLNQVALNILPNGLYFLISNQIRQRILVL